MIMIGRCLCCNNEIKNPTKYETVVGWHEKCIKGFLGTDRIPELDCSDKELEKLANKAVNKGLTVPGVQKKLSLHLKTTDRSPKLTIVDYPTGYILKPQSNEYSALPEAEFLSMKMAETAGIRTVPNALIHTGGQYSYITRRIDRVTDGMLAMEDFCQLSGKPTSEKYHSSYENCGRLIKTFSQNVGIDLAEFFYRLLFCFVTGNSDMHLKNFSLVENTPGSRRFGLAPAYDLLPVNVILPSDREQMALSLNGKKNNIIKKDFFILAENLGVHKKAAEKMMHQITKHEDAFVKEIDSSIVPDKMKEIIVTLVENRMKTISE